MSLFSTVLHIPDGINFECTGCGHCCLTWPVPLTQSDGERIGALAGAEIKGSSKGSGERPNRPLSAGPSNGPIIGPNIGPNIGPINNPQISPLKAESQKFQKFTYTLEKASDGRCVFLTEDERCSLHLEHGAEMKPAMCRLFPYTFTQTPTGVYASLCFASTGVLLNAGRPLSEQRHLLECQWQLFEQLFPDSEPDWSEIQLVDGVPIRWVEYLQLERVLLEQLLDRESRLLSSLKKKSDFLVEQISPACNLEHISIAEVKPRTVDELLLNELLRLYFPGDLFSHSSCQFLARPFVERLVKAPKKVNAVDSPRPVTFGEIANFKLGNLDEESESLLKRFVYCRIFSKLYFGAGLGSLSLLSGFNHLALIVALVRIKLKCDLLAREVIAGRPQFMDVVETVRTVERRLTVSEFSLEATATLEALLQSPDRLSRILSLAA